MMTEYKKSRSFKHIMHEAIESVFLLFKKIGYLLDYDDFIEETIPVLK